MKNLNRVLISSLMPLFFLCCAAHEAGATTTCNRNGCAITITINMVAVGGVQQTVSDWIQDIEGVWNGPVSGDGDSPTVGECSCPVRIEVNFAGWVNDCNDAAASSYHCIEITPGYARDAAGQNHRGYMKGISQNGSRTTGWWSADHMNQPVMFGPGEGRSGTPVYHAVVHDAAHEAGHLMGLADDYDRGSTTYGNNIMGRTWGEDAMPTQAQIDQIVQNNCTSGDGECPDECCCGNGEIESDKGEECDPGADPAGCRDDEVCVGCECYFSGFCGDGIISEGNGEECDPGAEPSGCMTGESCTRDCICEPHHGFSLTISVTSPPPGLLIDVATPVTVDIISSLGVARVDFLVDGITENSDSFFPYEWIFNPLDYSSGLHEITATVFDNGGHFTSDSVDVMVP